MKPLINYTGAMVCLLRDNINTDDILPKQFMRKIDSSGYGDDLFFNERYGEDGQLDPEFVLNRKAYGQPSILLTGENFGCGSARPHAVWALRDYGFRVLIATAFSRVFYVNCLNFGLLPAIVFGANHAYLAAVRESSGDEIRLMVDMETETIAVEGGRTLPFAVDAERKAALMQGKSPVDITLSRGDRITEFEKRQRERFPWLWELKDR